jgi:hypothetical protein
MLVLQWYAGYISNLFRQLTFQVERIKYAG